MKQNWNHHRQKLHAGPGQGLSSKTKDFNGYHIEWNSFSTNFMQVSNNLVQYSIFRPSPGVCCCIFSNSLSLVMAGIASLQRSSKDISITMEQPLDKFHQEELIRCLYRSILLVALAALLLLTSARLTHSDDFNQFC